MMALLSTLPSRRGRNNNVKTLSSPSSLLLLPRLTPACLLCLLILSPASSHYYARATSTSTPQHHHRHRRRNRKVVHERKLEELALDDHYSIKFQRCYEVHPAGAVDAYDDDDDAEEAAADAAAGADADDLYSVLFGKRRRLDQDEEYDEMSIQRYVTVRACFDNSACDESCNDKDYSEYTMTLESYLDVIVQHKREEEERYCEMCYECSGQDPAWVDERCQDLDTEECLEICSIIENMEENGYHDATEFVDCQGLRYDDLTNQQYWAGAICDSSGTGIKLGLFVDEECSVLNTDDSKSVESLFMLDKGLNLSYHLLKQTFAAEGGCVVNCSQEEEEVGDDAFPMPALNEVCQDLYETAMHQQYNFYPSESVESWSGEGEQYYHHDVETSWSGEGEHYYYFDDGEFYFLPSPWEEYDPVMEHGSPTSNLVAGLGLDMDIDLAKHSIMYDSCYGQSPVGGEDGTLFGQRRRLDEDESMVHHRMEQNMVSFRFCDNASSCDASCDSQHDEITVDMYIYLEFMIRHRRRLQERYCNKCQECADSSPAQPGADWYCDASLDPWPALMTSGACSAVCENIDTMEARGYLDAVDFIRCEQIYQNKHTMEFYFAGPTCASSGTQIKIGIFLDAQCLIPDRTRDVESYLRDGDGNELKLDYHLLNQTFDDGTCTGRCVDETEEEEEEDAMPEINEVCEELYYASLIMAAYYDEVELGANIDWFEFNHEEDQHEDKPEVDENIFWNTDDWTVKLHIISPPGLVKQEGYDHRLPLFGPLTYSDPDSISANIYYADSDLCASDVDASTGYPIREKDDDDEGMLPWPSPFILMVDRGQCTFVTKVRNAQKVGALAVIIADDMCLCYSDDPCESLPGQTCQQRWPILADDGSGEDITIPSLVMLKQDADAIKDELIENIYVEMKITFRPAPKSDKVEYELWTSPMDATSRDFLLSFNETAHALTGYAHFTPRLIIYGGERDACQSYDEENLCVGCYCAVDPDNDLEFGISGADVVRESLRWICIWQEGGTEPWFRYVSFFIEDCSGDLFANSNCIDFSLGKAGIDPLLVTQCINDGGGLEGYGVNDLLEEQLDEQQEQGVTVVPTFLVNGAQMRGQLDSDNALKAICAGFAADTAPPVCYGVPGHANLGRGSCLDTSGKWYSYLQSSSTFPTAKICAEEGCNYRNLDSYRGFEFSVANRCTCLFDEDGLPPIPESMTGSLQYVSRINEGNGIVAGASGTPGTTCYKLGSEVPTVPLIAMPLVPSVSSGQANNQPIGNPLNETGTNSIAAVPGPIPSNEPSSAPSNQTMAPTKEFSVFDDFESSAYQYDGPHWLVLLIMIPFALSA